MCDVAPKCEYCEKEYEYVKPGKWTSNCDCHHPSTLNKAEERILREQIETLKELTGMTYEAYNPPPEAEKENQ